MNHIQYDNRNLGKFVEWWSDNVSLLNELFIKSGKDENDRADFVFSQYIDATYDANSETTQAVINEGRRRLAFLSRPNANENFIEFCRNWDEKHAGEYRDQINKDNHDRVESRKNEWGI